MFSILILYLSLNYKKQTSKHINTTPLQRTILRFPLGNTEWYLEKLVCFPFTTHKTHQDRQEVGNDDESLFVTPAKLLRQESGLH